MRRSHSRCDIGGDDFYGWWVCCRINEVLVKLTALRFLGPRMIYTSGIITDITREETLEELQDNKLTVVCEKLNLKPEDRLLDIG